MSFSKHFQTKSSSNIDLKEFKTDETKGIDKGEAIIKIEKNHQRLFAEQSLLYAEKKRSILIILQGMDTAGKDGVIRHVMSGVNPQSCSVTSFKTPSEEELSHDFLWRIHKAVPARGEIKIFNRSQYEDVLIARVKNLVPADVWKERYEQINHFEKMLSQNNTKILKFFLHIGKDEQKKRLMERVSDPDKNWKLTESDVKERKYWKDYRKAYEEVLAQCSTAWAPWFIIPSDKKWFRNLAVSEIIIETFHDMHLKRPKPSVDVKKIIIE